ncbi:MAG: peptidoglycan-binding protein LysM [Candidatus Thiodiazotropha sp. (ex Lucinoma kastoroae)]|nr:peptidoglycan-binding protein LysM [Candidatus Thiodiazotropha sp.]MCU7802151.1 peptidoglycan-binding protein LysM [Candidatus Thiodiazotropha sp. (ex Lucinoma borealis)]MCU7817029.1 peptidoglycan-binding protein LysM [Candidatus Thiodiazotropha sp. (ex Rostrolucina anterorostrata)]MCU7838217.1 peptidoglycan-binding protein LysM [Candidatus Thiodiazotropha sp. (ex Troendleina suluensis)]MCU7849067.1 peptidoglycan-binding protein LysM [Candidatus Thiodiazotropha sp. (ex Lucinoma kastoroae)]M
MGLFDFAANMGRKLFGKDDDPADKIKKQIEADNPGIKDLDVNFEDGKVVLSGSAETAEALEKTVLIAGNVQGVSEVSASGITAPPQEAKVEYYVIESGDTLSAIAKRFLGKGSDYPKIFEANREVIQDPNKIYPGQKIRIPLD